MSMRGFAAALLALSMAGNAHALYPDRPIRLIVAQSPGGNADIIGRALAEGLGERLGQTVVVDNRGGASGIIAIELVVRAPADGHTLLLVASSFGVNPALNRKLPYDQQRDLAPITLVATAPNILVVGPALQIKSVADLIQVAKSKPGQLTFGSSGNLGSPHLAGELFKLMTGVDMVHVPYKGAAASLTDLIAGRISLSFASLPSAVGHVKSGRLRALAVTSEKRFSLTPDLPTVAESGLPGFETSAWQGLLAPAKTSRAIVNRINAESASSVNSPAMRNLLAANGAEGVGNSPEAFSAFVQAQIAKWTKVVRAAGIQAE
ncbi:MAG: tripartite tricarboxylate transporter substrate binding protein [Betaproteobacteria bacterium]|nr:tripartite tricarboxylate transporter substrate binding protein [Betaproteobacteria bacterium]